MKALAQPSASDVFYEHMASVLAPEAEGTVLAPFAQYRLDPVGFCTDVWGIGLAGCKGRAGSYQADILESCVANVRVSWRAAHGVGKTALMAWIIGWWLLTRPFARVIILAPAFERQVGRYLLPELKQWVRNSSTRLPLTVRVHTAEVEGYEREWYALAVQATDPSYVEGAHARHLCIIADEAKALRRDVIDALQGTQTSVEGDKLYFLASVPGVPSGPFYETFSSPMWASHHTAAWESDLVSEQWVEDRRRDWGEDSWTYQQRVAGEFSAQSDAERALIRLEWLDAARLRVPSSTNGGMPLEVGIDVAGVGEAETVAVLRQGAALREVRAWGDPDPRHKLATWLRHHGGPEVLGAIKVDVSGTGEYFARYLEDLGYQVVWVNVGRHPLGATDEALAYAREHFRNLKAQLYWGLRERFRDGLVEGLADDLTYQQLASLQWDEMPGSNRVRIESKEDMQAKRGLPSPDRAEAVMLAYAELPEQKVHVPFVV